MSKKQFFVGVFLASIFGALLALGGFKLFLQDEKALEKFESAKNVRFTNFLSDTSNFTVPDGMNFEYAAEQATPGVVHIKSTIGASSEGYAYQNPIEEYFRDFFGEGAEPRYRAQPQKASGSGVIISADGYIATNNHVVANASEIVVTLYDNREYVAKLVGTAPTTDIALIKVDADDLPFMKLGNSDVVKVGQWVLAVGNPFDLTSTVTAGIVSAKSRNINILSDQRGMQVEAFIQTDAAVNPGNSGGALVNLKGELIGINTAIATPTGTYAGYSFAVPVSLVKKVVNDLREYGVVQRALLGVRIRDIDAHFAEEQGFKALQGVYISDVNASSSAEEAGLESGDIITHIDGVEVNTVAQLQEQIARNRPGDRVKITYTRGGNEKTVSATLKNALGNTKVVKKDEGMEIDGATFVEVTPEELSRFEIQGGVKIDKIKSDKWRKAGLKEGFIITSINKRSISSVDQLLQAMQNVNGRFLLEGIYPDGRQAYGVVEF